MKIAQTIVVVGDVHSELALAVAALDRVEEQFGPIAQVFSVGDVGLFLEPRDWEFLTGPKKHRHSERSDQIAAAWKAWRWPLSMIGGNHEPYQWLREFAAERFGEHLNYTNAGLLSHRVSGLQVYGLSGIHHPEHLTFASSDDRAWERPQQWVDLVHLVAANKASLKRLTYYKQTEIDRLLALPGHPDLLLLHDWPVPPPHARGSTRRPERDIVERLAPKYVCSGHHHMPAETMLGTSTFIGLNIISSRDELNRYAISPGWAAIFSRTELTWKDVPSGPRWSGNQRSFDVREDSPYRGSAFAAAFLRVGCCELIALRSRRCRWRSPRCVRTGRR